MYYLFILHNECEATESEWIQFVTTQATRQWSTVNISLPSNSSMSEWLDIFLSQACQPTKNVGKTNVGLFTQVTRTAMGTNSLARKFTIHLSDKWIGNILHIFIYKMLQ